MRILKLIVPALALVVARPAFAEQTSTGTVANSEIVVQGQQYEKKVVCRQQQNTGTRFATRVCNTNKVWDEMREQHRRAAKDMIDTPKYNPPENH